MRVNTKQAVRLFFQNPSLVQVFKEAVANSVDANANQIDINILLTLLISKKHLELKSLTMVKALLIIDITSFVSC